MQSSRRRRWGGEGSAFTGTNTASVSKQILSLKQSEENVVLIDTKTMLGLSPIPFCNLYSGL